MLSAKAIIPECYVDTCLIDVLLGFEKESANHTKGNATVLRKMEIKFANSVCVGIIDKDKIELIELKTRYSKIEIGEISGYFEFYKHKERNHFVIQIVPAIEGWIIEVVNILGIKLEDFGIFESNAEELTNRTKNVNMKFDPTFKRVFREILKRSESQSFLPLLRIRAIVLKILEKGHLFDINELKHV